MNLLENVRQVVQDFLVAKAQYPQTQSLEFGLPHRIIDSSLGCVMNTAISFDNQICTSTIKIHNIAPKRFLPQKSHPQTRAAQCLPQHILGFGRILTHLALELQQIRCFSHCRSIQPTLYPSLRDTFLSPARRKDKTRLQVQVLRAQLTPKAVFKPLSRVFRERSWGESPPHHQHFPEVMLFPTEHTK